MKSILIAILIVGSCLSAFTQPTIDAYLANNKCISRGGSIESIEETYELLIKDIPPKPFKLIYKYNNSGYIISETRFNNFNAKQSETVWTYGTNNNLTKKNQTYFMNMIGWKVDEIILKYNDTTGFISDIQSFKNKSMEFSSKVFCDKFGIPYEVRVLDEKGAYEGIERLSYSPNVNLIRVMTMKASGKFAGITIYPIDYTQPYQIGSIERQFYPNGDVMMESLDYQTKTDQGYYYEYKYDERGNWIEKQTFQVTLGKNNKIKDKKLEHKVIRKINYY